MPKSTTVTTPKYKEIYCHQCRKLIHRFDRTEWENNHVPTSVIMMEIRNHYLTTHPIKYRLMAVKAVTTRIANVDTKKFLTKWWNFSAAARDQYKEYLTWYNRDGKKMVEAFIREQPKLAKEIALS